MFVSVSASPTFSGWRTAAAVKAGGARVNGEGCQRTLRRHSPLGRGARLAFRPRSPIPGAKLRSVHCSAVPPGEEKVRDEQERAMPDAKQVAKELFTLYGPVYLGTSLVFAAISFVLFYALVSAGVDIRQFIDGLGNLLAKTPIGRPAALDQIPPQVGNAALAYIAHKAASPLRFPITVAAVPLVARLFKKNPKKQ